MKKMTERGIGVKILLTFICGIALAFVLSLSNYSIANSEFDIENQAKNGIPRKELLKTKNSGRVLQEQNIATATGVGRIMEDTAQGRLLGRRGALTDARRNLLILRQKLLKTNRHGVEGTNLNNVSGKVSGVVIHSNKVIGNLYYLQVDIPLDKLMEW